MNRFSISLALLLSLNIQAQLNVNLVGHLSYNYDLNDLWGYVDPLGNEYAIVGNYEGVSVVSLIDPSNPIEIDFIDRPNSTWRDMKVWQNYAYVLNENSGGLLIIDLSNLPTSISYTTSDCGIGFREAHNIFIDEFGKAYLFAGKSDSLSNGTYIVDLSVSPQSPNYLGKYNTYIHDGFVRGDTLWASQIYEGNFAAIDVSNPTTPMVLATQQTPKEFTHACWLSNDGNTLTVADEKSGAWVTTYDVSDLTNIKELDRFQTHFGNNVVVHNTHFKNEYIYNSYYTSGISILDATYPNNLVQVGYYDTSPLSGSAYDGCWGVFNYFPSGNFIASDQQEGLFVFSFNDAHAGYLEGQITNAATDAPINNATIHIVHPEHYSTNTDFLGNYKTGIPGSTTANAIAYANGFYSDTIQVTLTEGQITTQNFSLQPVISCSDSYGIQVKLFLEAMFDSITYSMNANLNTVDLIPYGDAYNFYPFNYNGDEFVYFFDNSVIDWVYLELRDANNPTLIVDKRIALLQQDGFVKDIDGSYKIKFCNATLGGSYYLAIYHKSHLGIISSNNFFLPTTTSIDFTINANQAAGIQQQKSVNGKAVLHVGDYDNSGIINNQDFNKWAINNALINQYVTWDADGSGIVNNLDFNFWEINKSKVGNNLIAK